MLKGQFAELTEKIGIRIGILFSKIPLTPNQWTVVSVLPAIAGFYALAVLHDMMLGLALFVLAAVADAIDGGVARVTGRVTNLGAYLDGMFDRFVEGFLLFGLMLFGLPDFELWGYTSPMWLWLALLLFVGSALVSFARAYADHRKVITDEKQLRKMGGILERAERLILVFIGMLAYYFSPLYTDAAVVLAALLSAVTLLQRIWFVVRNAE